LFRQITQLAREVDAQHDKARTRYVPQRGRHDQRT
jgi:hypothetical protein